MTVIAWDGRTLAADRRMSTGAGGDIIGTTCKIERCGAELMGVTGNLSIGRELMAWYRAGAVPSNYPPANRNLNEGASLIVVRADGSLWKYESSPHPFACLGGFIAFGSGELAAKVALACGRNAVEAVELASLFCSSCGSGVDALDLHSAC